MNSPTIERNTLGACLQAADRDQVLSTASAVVEGLHMTPLQPAESGLALLQWRDSVMHHAFYLGEVPMAQAAIVLTDDQGRRAEGGAVVMRDDAELAQALAVLDAIWAHSWPGYETIYALASSGARKRARSRAERQAVLKRTRVDFSLLSQADDESEEA